MSLEWAFLGKDAAKVGDLVSADAGGMPIYRVLEVANGRLRVQDEAGASVRTLPADHLHWRAAQAKAGASR